MSAIDTVMRPSSTSSPPGQASLRSAPGGAAQGRGSEIVVEAVSRRFGSFLALDNVDLTVAAGEFLTLLGPSGSGKTTLLAAIAGFQTIDSGTIRVDGRPIQDVSPHRRGFGMVFQSYALFPHMTVGQNVAFPLRMAGVGRREADRRVHETLGLMKLDTFADRVPAQLSGGQQQRVAIARAIVRRPSVVLMDEPLSALDRRLREAIQLELRDLHRIIGTTIVFVTHDQGEALALSDRIAVLSAGRIVQVDTPSELYRRPVDGFVAGFVGESNLLDGTVLGRDGAGVVVEAEGIRFAAGCTDPTLLAGSAVKVLLRPERIALVPAGPGALAIATVTGTANLGEIRRVDLRLPSGCAVQVRALDARDLPRSGLGDTVGLSWDAGDCWVLP